MEKVYRIIFRDTNNQITEICELTVSKRKIVSDYAYYCRKHYGEAYTTSEIVVMPE